MKLAIDDSTVVAPADTKLCEKYHARYSQMAKDLGLSIKEHDQSLDKAFNPNQKGGNILGLFLDLPTRSWQISELKMNHICETFAQTVKVTDVYQPVLATLKDVQEVVGLVNNFAKSSQLLRTLAIIVNAEAATFDATFWDENIRPKERQSKLCLFSHQARVNLATIRAILLSTASCPLPMEKSKARFLIKGGAHFTFYCDASGKPKEITADNYKPTCLGCYRPATLQCSTATLKSFILPYSWLMSADNKGLVYHHTSLLEFLPMLCELLSEPARYRRKSLVFYTDNQATVSLFQRQNPVSIFTAYVLESINLMEMALECNIRLSWKRRRSSYGMALADDATHANHSRADDSIICTRQSLPTPLFNVIHCSENFLNHKFNFLRREIKLYLRDKCPDVKFPV